MRKFIKNYLATVWSATHHILLAIVCAAVVMAPDHIVNLFNGGYQTRFSIATLLVLTVLFSLALLGSTTVFLCLAGSVVFLQFAQLLHISYFGSLISPHAVILFFSDYAEIVETLGALPGYLVIPVLVAALEMLLLVFLFRKTRHLHKQIPFAWMAILALMLILPVQANNPKATAQQYYPNPRNYSVANTFFAVSYFLGRDLPDWLGEDQARPSSSMACEPYQSVRTGDPLADNVVIVMGESLSAAHMSVFGYSRDTTPKLRALVGSSELSATIAYSAGVSTKVTLPMFYNVQREPGNFRHMIRMESSLFRFAKQQGFSTHYVSSQTANLATYVGERYIDHFVTKEDMEVSMATRKDRVLVDALKNIDLSQRNFIVLHQRSSHSPYDQQYPPEFARYPLGGADYVDFTTNSYDNAVSFTDEVVAEIIDHLKAHSQGRTLLVFTADHSELLGEGGKYGHTHLQIETARVPLMVYGKNLGPDVQQRLYGLSQPTHYEIGKEISAILGYRVVNPNEEPGIYYVNGPDIGGRAGYMTIDKRVSPPRSTLIQDMSVNESVCEINAAKPVTVSVDANSLSPFR